MKTAMAELGRLEKHCVYIYIYVHMYKCILNVYTEIVHILTMMVYLNKNSVF